MNYNMENCCRKNFTKKRTKNGESYFCPECGNDLTRYYHEVLEGILNEGKDKKKRTRIANLLVEFIVFLVGMPLWIILFGFCKLVLRDEYGLESDAIISFVLGTLIWVLVFAIVRKMLPNL